jgi:hypothetical protein
MVNLWHKSKYIYGLYTCKSLKSQFHGCKISQTVKFGKSNEKEVKAS